jgi:ribonuclease BN (tRNA processing enzyme)
MKEFFHFTGNDAPGSAPGLAFFSEGFRCLFNCPEGIQRFSGDAKLRLSRMHCFCITRVSAHTIMGLPGVAFTVNDAGVDQLTFVGPPTLIPWWAAIENAFFTYRKLQLSFCIAAQGASVRPGAESGSRVTSLVEPQTLGTPAVRLVPIFLPVGDGSRRPPIVCYLLAVRRTTSKFSPELAKKLGVKPGPKYSALKRGESVQSDIDPARWVRPEEVMVSAEDSSGVPAAGADATAWRSTLVLDIGEHNQGSDSSGSSPRGRATVVLDALRYIQCIHGSELMHPSSLHTVIHLTPDESIDEDYLQQVVEFFQPSTGGEGRSWTVRHEFGPRKCPRVNRLLFGLDTESEDGGKPKEPSERGFSARNSPRVGIATTSSGPREPKLTETLSAAVPTAHLHQLHLHLCCPEFFPHHSENETSGREDGPPLESPPISQRRWPFAYRIDALNGAVAEFEGFPIPNLKQAAECLSTGFQESWLKGDSEGKGSVVSDLHSENMNSVRQILRTTSPLLLPDVTRQQLLREGGLDWHGKVTFLGTGSACPSKYRNVSSFLIESVSEEDHPQLSQHSSWSAGPPQRPATPAVTAESSSKVNHWSWSELRNDSGRPRAVATEGLLCDAGEGTLTQLACTVGGDLRELEGKLRGIQLVFISHMHADHNLGLFSLLDYREKALQSEPHHRQHHVSRPHSVSPHPFISIGNHLQSGPGRKSTSAWCTIVCPREFLQLSQALAQVDSSFDIERCGRVVTLQNPVGKQSPPQFRPRTPHPTVVVPSATAATNAWSTTCFPVDHPANAHGAVFVHSKSNFKICYSGDTRPCPALTLFAKGSDVLIHEATFADQLQKEAIEKKHSTFSEAMEMARRCEAKCLLLTHFSQRYPKGPTSASGGDSNCCSAPPSAVAQQELDSPSTAAVDQAATPLVPPVPYCFAFDTMVLPLRIDPLLKACDKMPVFYALLAEYESWTDGLSQKLRVGTAPDSGKAAPPPAEGPEQQSQTPTGNEETPASASPGGSRKRPRE